MKCYSFENWATLINIEHNCWAWGQSLKLRSTVDLGFILSSFHHHCHHLNPPSWNLGTSGALPSHEGCGPIDGREGGTRGGTQEMGGPSSTFFFPLFLTPLTTSQPNAHKNAPNNNEDGHTTMRTTKRGPNDNPATKRQASRPNNNHRVKQQGVSPVNNSTWCRAEQKGIQLYDTV